MAEYLRLRQVCLVASELAPVVGCIEQVTGLRVCHRDPLVSHFGLENAIFRLGDAFIEVVAPIAEGTAAARFLERSGGRGGYMAIFDCHDAAARARHAGELGIRIASDMQVDEYHGVQLHPRDCRAAMIEFNHTRGGEALAGPYAPAGPDWQACPAAGEVRDLLAVQLASPDPRSLMLHWARILDLAPVTADGSALLPDHGRLEFVAGEHDHLSALRLLVRNVPAMLRRAIDAGLPVTGDAFRLAGVEWRLQD